MPMPTFNLLSDIATYCKEKNRSIPEAMIDYELAQGRSSREMIFATLDKRLP
jgi:hypothetical protein